jgi:hypothetical protein
VAALVDTVRVDQGVIAVRGVPRSEGIGDPSRLRDRLCDVIYADFYCQWNGVADPGEAMDAGSIVAALVQAAADVPAAAMSDGFVHVYGGLGGRGTEVPDARFYWNVGPVGACAVLAAVRANLVRFGVPFHFKCPVDSPGFGRTDTAVLYVQTPSVAVVAALLGARIAELRPHLRDGTPAFTLRLETGLAFAENPPSGESFGRVRSQLFADAFLHADRDAVRGRDEHIAAIEAFVERCGYRCDALFRNPGSLYPYRLRPFLPAEAT